MSNPTTEAIDPAQKVPFREKLGCSCGDYSISLIWQTFMYFLPIFYTDTVGLTPAFMAGLFFWVRILDGVTDPLCGMVCDRTRTRWGSYRPYLLWFSIPYALAIVLMFYSPDTGMLGKQIYAAITYAFMILIYTITSTPNNIITGVISADPRERASVSTYKFTFAYGGGLTVQLLIIPLVSKLGAGDDGAGYTMTMAIFAVITCIGLLVTFFTVTERVDRPVEKSSIRQDLHDLWNNKPWLFLSGMVVACLVYIAIRSASIAYYFKYFLHREDQMGWFMAIGTIFTMLGVLPTKFLATRFGKTRVVKACLILCMLSLVAFYFPGADNIVLLYALQIIFSFASGPVFPLIWTMLADTSDYSELKNGRRATGLIFSSGTFAIKLGFAIGGSIVMLILGAFGFVANELQSQLSLTGIRLCMSFVPAAIVLIGLLSFYGYRLDEAKMMKITTDLHQSN